MRQRSYRLDAIGRSCLRSKAASAGRHRPAQRLDRWIEIRALVTSKCVDAQIAGDGEDPGRHMCPWPDRSDPPCSRPRSWFPASAPRPPGCRRPIAHVGLHAGRKMPKQHLERFDIASCANRESKFRHVLLRARSCAAVHLTIPNLRTSSSARRHCTAAMHCFCHAER